MKKAAYFILISTSMIFYSAGVISAQAEKMDSQSYNSQKEELLLQRDNLLKVKTGLTNEIANLHILLENLDAELKIELPKFFKKKYGKKDGSRIAMGQIWKGMTEQMMRDSWGEPDKTNTDRFSYGVFKQLQYGKVIYFFRDNKLIDWEEAK